MTRLESAARSLPVRLLLPAIFLAAHLLVLGTLARERFSLPFNSAPGAAPAFHAPATDPVPTNWRRLIVSRWDAQHYITLALRGYEYCADRANISAKHPPDADVVCQLNFFPGYSLLGRAVAKIARVPVDYALLGISLAASWVAMFLWTSREMVAALGFATTYLSLLLLNVFTTGYALVTVQTEPCAIALTVAAFVLLERRQLLLGALCAGAAGAIRPTGVPIGVAFALAVFALTLRERPRISVWLARVGVMAVAGWGIAALLGYWQHRFGDALIYAHARTRYYHYVPDPLALLAPKYTWISQSIWAAPNEGVWLAAALLLFALGHRSGFAGFSPPAKVYWYAVFVLVVGLAATSQVEIGFSGMSRYLLLALPLFFATAAALRRHPAALVLWILFSAIHYWTVNACFYVGHGEPGFWQVCHCQPGA
jgi:hypothetical protein